MAAIGWLLAARLLAASQAHVGFEIPLWWIALATLALGVAGTISVTAGRLAVVGAAVLFVLLPAVRLAELRPHVETANEAVPLSEDALAALRAGANPYTADMAPAVQRSGYPRPPGYEKTGVGYPPLAFLAYPILEVPSRALTGVADPRPAYGLLAVGLAVFLALRARDRVQLSWAAVASSSGLLAYSVTEGTHDAIVIALLVAALARWRHAGQAAVLVGTAAAVKTLVWPALPVVLVLLSGLRWGRLWRVAPGLALPLAVTLLPFLLWDPVAVLRALFLTDDDAPARGLSLRGPVESVFGVDLAWPLRLLAVAVACALALWAVRRGRAMLPVVAGAVIVAISGVQVFSHVHHPYHLALPVALMVTSGLLPRRGSPLPRTSP